MTAADICLIIETGGKAGLSKFRYHGLELIFSSSAPRIEFVERGAPPVIAGVTEPTELTPDQTEALAEYDDDNLALTNPEENERRIMLAMQEGVSDGTLTE